MESLQSGVCVCTVSKSSAVHKKLCRNGVKYEI